MEWARRSIQKISSSTLLQITIVSCVLACQLLYADKFNTETSSSAQALGAGNAAINLSRGAVSIFYNPANIAAKNTGAAFQVVNVKMGFSDGFTSMFARKQFANTFNLASLVGRLNSQPNTYAGTQFAAFPNITIRNLSLGMLYEVDQGAKIRPDDLALLVRARNRFAPVAALSFRLFSGVLRFGLSSQYLTVGNASTVIEQPSNRTDLAFEKLINSGSGLVHTAGLTLTLPFQHLPSFSAVVRNIGNTTFKSSPMFSFGSGTEVPVQLMTVDLAGAYTVYLGKRLELKMETDYKDVMAQIPSMSILRRTFIGAELSFINMIHLRTGMLHGYMTYGLGIHTPKANLDLAVYTEELDDRLRANPDVRYVLQYSYNLFGKIK